MKNQVNLIGRTANIETKAFKDGTPYKSFSLAIQKKWTNKETGEIEKKTTWINCQIIGNFHKVLDLALAGGQICVLGELQNFKMKIGEKEVTMLQLKVKDLVIIDWKPKTL
jgi:single-stranded DNA-binding protein